MYACVGLTRTSNGNSGLPCSKTPCGVVRMSRQVSPLTRCGDAGRSRAGDGGMLRCRHVDLPLKQKRWDMAVPPLVFRAARLGAERLPDLVVLLAADLAAGEALLGDL